VILMATDSLRKFLEDRLLTLDPSLDIEPGSPAQIQFIEPVLDKLGTDPLETDIEAFLLDRLAQEFPDIYAEDPGVMRDLFIKPLILFLTPFKREAFRISVNQSLRNPLLLSDDDADALIANFFDYRDSGNFSDGDGRVFFSNPTTVSIEITDRFFTANGLSFFPSAPFTMTAEQMVFNRSGSLFFMDVSLRAEREGAEYNIEPGALVGVEGLAGVVKVTNLRRFSNGSSMLDTESFVAQAESSLTERSLVSRRGATARLRQVFRGEAKAIQVIGAKDPEMQRDILVGSSPGHAWLTGRVTLYKKLAMVRVRVIDSSTEMDVPRKGDTLYIYLDSSSYSAKWATLPQLKRFLRLKVEELLIGPITDGDSQFQAAYLIRWSGEVPDELELPDPVNLEGGISKKGTIKISAIPMNSDLDLEVENASVHVYGHTDIFLRPITQNVSKAVIANVMDESPLFEGLTLETWKDSNKITDLDIDFVQLGVATGDVVILENGQDSGIYLIGSVTNNDLFLTSTLTTDATNIRYKIINKIRLDLFNPKIIKFPFGDLLANDLQATIGENLIKFATNDLISFGVRIGDVLEILEGVNKGLYTIEGFDAVLGGRGLLVDRPVGGTEFDVRYTVFTQLDSIQKPLVRIKEITLLDSAGQETSVFIPPADPVGAVAFCEFTSARVKGLSRRNSGFVLPDIHELFSDETNVAAASGDRRYSLGFDDPEGFYKSVIFADGSESEFAFKDNAKGSTSYFMAISENPTEEENFPPIDPKPGQSLHIKSGPNKGSYLVKEVHKFKHKVDVSGDITAWTYFIKIHGSFPQDPIRELLSFLEDRGIAWDIEPSAYPFLWPDFFYDWYENLKNKVRDALLTITPNPPSVESIEISIKRMVQADYEWGEPASGIIRTFFTKPTLFEIHTGEKPTLFSFKTPTETEIFFRPALKKYRKYQLLPAYLSEDISPVEYPRDLDTSVPLEISLTDTSRPSVFEKGIQPGDTLSVHEEVFLFNSIKEKMAAIRTIADSPTVTAVASFGPQFNKNMIGNMVFIDEGEDEGGYVITDVPDSKTLVLDKALSTTSPHVITHGVGDAWGYDDDENRIRSATPEAFAGMLHKWITIYGLNYEYQGSYQISEVQEGGDRVAIARSAEIGDFPAWVVDTFYWAITDAPDTQPEETEKGTELYGLRPFRMYNRDPKDVQITQVSTSLEESKFDIQSLVRNAFNQPYRIFREDILRITPTEMENNREGPFYYFDTEVLSLSPHSVANLNKDSFLTLKEGNYKSQGYRHLVKDKTLTYSMLEEGYLYLPTKVLTLNLPDSLDNYLNILQSSLEISYERAQVVENAQEFVDSPLDRVTSANLLVRHFLPSYVSYEADYYGGSSPSVIAKDIITYIDNLPVETPIDVSELEERITRRGGNQETPNKVWILIHDLNRKMWVEFSKNKIGGIQTVVPYDGTPRVSYFIPGSDMSGVEDIPDGERILLRRL